MKKISLLFFSKTLLLSFFIFISTQSLASELVGDTEHSKSIHSSYDQCEHVKLKFKSHIIQTVSDASDSFSRNEECASPTSIFKIKNKNFCENLNLENEINLNEYRNLLRKFRSKVALQWAKTHPQQDLIKFCFKNKNTFFSKNTRVLNVNSSSVNCRPLKTDWSLEQSNLEVSYLYNNDKPLQGISKKELNRLKFLRESPFIRQISEQEKSLPSKLRQDDQKLTQEAYSKLKKDSDSLRKKIIKLQDSQLFSLYSFETLHEHFLNSLSNNKERSEALKCKASDGWAKDCLQNKDKNKLNSFELLKAVNFGFKISYDLFSDEKKNCSARIKKIFTELTPVIGSIDAYAKIKFNSEARSIGFLTIEEYAEKQASALVQLGGLLPSASLGKGAASLSVKIYKDPSKLRNRRAPVAKFFPESSSFKTFLDKNPLYHHQLLNKPKAKKFFNSSKVAPELAVITPYKTFRSLLSRPERIGLEEWTGNRHIQMSEYYRKGGALDSPSKKLETCRDCYYVEQAIKKLPKYEGVVFRGVRIRDQKIREGYLTEGAVVSDASFSSAARSYDRAFYAEKEEGVLFVMRSRTGRSIENIVEKKGYGKQHEQEVIFSPNTEFIVDAVIDNPSGGNIVFVDELLKK